MSNAHTVALVFLPDESAQLAIEIPARDVSARALSRATSLARVSSVTAAQGEDSPYPVRPSEVRRRTPRGWPCSRGHCYDPAIQRARHRFAYRRTTP